MVCGAAGVGKSSFAELFIEKINITDSKFVAGIMKNRVLNHTPRKDKDGNKVYFLNSKAIKPATEGFTEKSIESTNKGDKFKLTMVDSPGYGDKSDIGEWR